MSRPALAQAVAHAVIAREVGRGFRRRHDVIGRQRVFRVRQRDIDHLGAGILQPCDALAPQRLDLARHAVEAVLLRNADLHALDRAAERRLVVRHRQVDRGRVLRIVPRHRAHQQRGVAHRAGNRTGLVERGGERHDAPARAAPIGRLQPDRAGERGRLADRAAGVGRGRAEAEMRRDRRGRAAGRAARHQMRAFDLPARRRTDIRALAPPRVHHRAEARGLVRRAHRELVIVELAEHDRAVAPQIGGDGRTRRSA